MLLVLFMAWFCIDHKSVRQPFLVKAEGCQKYDPVGPPPAPSNLSADYLYSYDNTMVTVYMKWSSPDLIGYLSDKNTCINSLDGWGADVSKLPLSDYKYLIVGDDGTNIVVENNYFGVNMLNSGGFLKHTFNASNKVMTKNYQIYTFRNNNGIAPIISQPAKISITIYPLEPLGCTEDDSSGALNLFPNIDCQKSS